MSQRMLSRLKSASPKLKIFLGLWLALEVLSIPAAAAFAWAFGLPAFGQQAESQLVAEKLETDIPGVSHFVVTHSDAFDIAVGGASDTVRVKVEDAYQRTPTVSGCARMTGASPRVVKTVAAPPLPEKPIATLFVTVTHDDQITPDIRFETYADLPQALPCQIG